MADEYISRQAVIEEFNTWIPMTQQERKTLDAIMQTLNEIHAENVIPTEWIVKQIQEQSLGESKAYSKLLKLWESESNDG